MSLRWLVAAGSLWVGACGWHSTSDQPLDALRSLGVARLGAQDEAAAQQALVDKYCLTCHNDRAKTGGFTLEGLSLANAGAHPDVWEKVIRKIDSGMMPPPGGARPDAAARDRFVAWTQGALDRAAAASPNPGRPLAHRLNRAEYANAIRDLLALEVDV